MAYIGETPCLNLSIVLTDLGLGLDMTDGSERTAVNGGLHQSCCWHPFIGPKVTLTLGHDNCSQGTVSRRTVRQGDGPHQNGPLFGRTVRHAFLF